MAEADRQKLQSVLTGDLQDAMSPLGKGSMIQLAVDALQQSRSDDPLAAQRIVAQTLGGVKTEDINGALLPQFNAFNDKRKAVEDLHAEILKEKDPAKRAAMQSRANAAHLELSAQAADLAKAGEQFGMFTADTVTPQDLKRARETDRLLGVARRDISGLSGSFGADVSAEQLAREKASNPPQER